MAELNVKQIENKLNQLFTGDTRKLVFWYDDKGDFAEDINSLQLEQAKIHILTQTNQFATKYLLERQDTSTNYLLYAPFPKPLVRENHLEDVLLYSTRFFADRVSLLCADLKIKEEFKPVLEKHIAFFGSKERTKLFYDLEIDTYNETTILVGIMSALCRCKVCSFEEVLRQILCKELSENPYLQEFAKYDVLGEFWRQCAIRFDYQYNETDNPPTLSKLVATLFTTAAVKAVKQDVPATWLHFISAKSGNIITFLDSMKDNVHYQERYDELSAYIAGIPEIEKGFKSFAEDSLVNCDVFSAIDQKIIRWIVARLLNEDTGAMLDEKTIPEICIKRQRLHFGKHYETAYDVLYSAWHVISAAAYTGVDGLKNIIKVYTEQDCQIDQMYRHFYMAYDMLNQETVNFGGLRELVEQIYTNEYLSTLLPKWNEGLQEPNILTDIELPLERHFYQEFLEKKPDKIAVIISDALRYEVGRELCKRLQDDPNNDAAMTYMLSTLPSYTRLGMAALLPHDRLELNAECQELVDGTYCIDLASRQAVLQKTEPKSICVQFDDIKGLNKADMRKVMNGKQLIYIYHDQIDVRGEHAEDEVFLACEEAIRELIEVIRRLFVNGNVYHFIITADHGFIYKRDKVTESDKISGVHGLITKRRYIISDEPVEAPGVNSLPLGYVLGNDDTRYVSYPSNVNVFKAPGGGLNYVHGGSSPQEMIIPVIDVKVKRGHVETKSAEIRLASMLNKVTNLRLSLDFFQVEPVSDVVKETTYQMFFVDKDGKAISQEQTYVANSREPETKDRFFKRHFEFKNQVYDYDARYYFVIRDKNTGLELSRQEVTIDIPFAGDFGF